MNTASHVHMFADLQHNVEGHSYKLGFNEFSDMSPDEFRVKLGYKPRATLTKTNGIPMAALDKNEYIPESIDWVAKGVVSSVKNQLHCGSCFTFSACGEFQCCARCGEPRCVACDDVWRVTCVM